MKSVLKSSSLLPLVLSSVLAFGLIVGLLAFPSAKADNLYASIRGTVLDQTGASVPDVKLTATNRATGVSYSTTSHADGGYAFLQVPIGDYDVTAQKQGFTKFLLSKLHLDVNQVYALDIKMEVGQLSETVTVEANAVQVNTSTPQLGSVVDANEIVNMPLIGRNWVNLQQTLPGVVGASDGRGGFATNGSQSQQNSYLINGTDTNDIALNTPLIIPSPDAIAEFRMVTGTINPEYGRNSGATINALIKSGTNSFHGDVFEFYRDPFLNAKNFFAPAAVFHQNQFGATIGGPIWKRHIFGFFSYQGTRARQPQGGVSSDVPVYTTAQRGGDFSGDVDPVTGVPFIEESTVKAPIALFGDSLSPCPASGGTRCAANTTTYKSLFSTGKIPTQDMDSIANTLVTKFVPLPNLGGTDFSFNPITTLTADQYLFRIDDNLTSKDTLWGTWYQQNNPSVSTIPFTGATLPGFASTNQSHLKMVTLSWTHVLNDHMVNELRGGYTRLNFKAVFPVTPVLPSSVGFQINPQSPSGSGLPVINVSGLFSLGFTSNGPQPRVDQTYQATDNFSLTKGHHTIKFGFDMRRFQVSSTFLFGNSGTYTFGGGGTFTTGDAGADFFLGIPDSFNQGSGGFLDVRAQEYYSYFQDEYKLRPNLTLTFGSGWTVDTPMVDKAYNNNAMVAFSPNQQSVVFPNAPIGYVFQGDPGVHASGSLHAFKYFGPRFGFAWSPDLGWLSGGPGKLSIRGGYGIYYNRYEEELTLQFLGMPPFTISSAGAGSLQFGAASGNPGFANPYVDIAGRGSISNPFPFSGVVPKNVQFTAAAGYLPLWQACCGTVDPGTVDPMAENFNLTLERQLTKDMKMSLGYVGAVAHHLSVGLPVNIPKSLSKLAADCAAVPGTCDSFGGATSAFPNDYLVNPSIYGPIDQISSIGNSNYNSFQATLERRLSRGLQFGASYTYAHSLDDGSGFENTSFGGGGFGGLGSVRAANPYCRHCDYASSIFDARHRLALSVFYQIPTPAHSAFLSRVTGGWTVASLPTFSTGFPLDVVDASQLRSFVCQAAFSDFACPDVPNLVGPIKYYNPRTTHTPAPGLVPLWFNGRSAPDPNAFAPEAFGTIGNAGRNILRGPGRNNWDFELYKDTHITETKYVQLRIELYNVFNHTQWDPAGISTNATSSRFGRVTRAFAPRQIQLAAKFYF